MKSRCRASFWQTYDSLESSVQRSADVAFERWSVDPWHRGLQFKCVNSELALYSARVGLHYRALCVRILEDEGPIYEWFWIGTHAEYDKLIG